MRIERLALIVASILVVIAQSGETGETFFLPGIVFSHLSTEPGSWCRYLLVDHALGQADSAEVYVAVMSVEDRNGKGAFWMEIASGPYRGGAGGREIIKLLVSGTIKDRSRGESLGDHILRLYVREGDGPVREEDPQVFSRLRLEGGASDSLWTVTEGESLVSSLGVFECEKKECTIRREKETSSKGRTFIRKIAERYSVWFSPRVPIFHVVRCVIERKRESRMVPSIPGVPVSGKRETETVLELTGFGSGAETLLPLHE